MQFVIQILLSALAYMIGARLLRGVHIEDYFRAIIVAFVIAILNATLGTFLEIASLGILWVLGLVLDAIIIMVADYFLKGMSVKNFWWALALAIIVSIVNWVTFSMFGIS